MKSEFQAGDTDLGTVNTKKLFKIMVQNEVPQREHMKYDKNAKDGNVQSNIFLWSMREI